MKRLLFLLGLLFIPTAILALEFKYIYDDAHKFEEELNWQESEQKSAWEDAVFQESNLLFLDINDSSNSSESGSLLDNSKFVIVTMNGQEITLEDVPTDTWFAPFVRSAAEQGIVSGYRDKYGVLQGLFGPSDNVSVEQLAKMAMEASGVYLPNCNSELINESAKDSWSNQYIACAENLGWAIFSDGEIDVMQSATRSEVIVTILQAFSVSFAGSTGDVFEDVNASVQFSGAIEKAASDFIVSGYADEDGNSIGLFGPSDSVTRAEVAKIVTLAKDVYGR